MAGTDIPAREVSNEFDTRLRQMQQQYGANLDRRAAVSLGLLNQALEAPSPAGWSMPMRGTWG